MACLVRLDQKIVAAVSKAFSETANSETANWVVANLVIATLVANFSLALVQQCLPLEAAAAFQVVGSAEHSAAAAWRSFAVDVSHTEERFLTRLKHPAQEQVRHRLTHIRTTRHVAHVIS